MPYFRILRSVELIFFLVEVSGQLVGPTFNDQGIREDGRDMLSLNFGRKLLFYAA